MASWRQKVCKISATDLMQRHRDTVLQAFFEKLSKQEDATELLISSRVQLGSDFYRTCAAFAKLSEIYKFDKLLSPLGRFLTYFRKIVFSLLIIKY